MSEAISNLQTWYFSQCNGIWEHSHGIEIGTLDNPGWSVSIDIVNTYLENEKFNDVQIERDSKNWIFCNVKDGVFLGVGGSENLLEIISVFLNWTNIASNNSPVGLKK